MICIPEKDACYSIQGLIPRTDMPYGSAYNFTIHIKTSVALKFRDVKLTDERMINFNKVMAQALQPMWGKQKIYHSADRPIFFYEDTLLLRYCTVPGDACDLGISGEDLNYLQSITIKGVTYYNLDYAYGSDTERVVVEHLKLRDGKYFVN